MPLNWNVIRLNEVLYYEQPTNYIVTNTEYCDSYTTPVLTAGKSFILGHTNETTGIYNNLPCIIFDDFTTDSKFVDFPFKVKSSAMKILTNNKYVSLKFIYYSMHTIDCIVDTHKRFWISDYSNKPIYLPPLAEQQRIVKKIEELFAQVDKIEEEKQSLLKLIDMAKNKVLDLAMKGKLVKQDPNDEPASVLLEKIFEEKKKLAKEGKIKLSKDKLLEPKISDDNDYYEKFKTKSSLPLGTICSLIKPKIEEKGILPYLEVKYLRNQTSAKMINKGMFLDVNSHIILVDGENSGEVFDIKEKGYMGSTFMELIIPKCLNERYIKYFIDSKKILLKNNKKGSAIPHLNKEMFRTLDIHLPCLSNQNKIVTLLDRLNIEVQKIKAELV